MLEFFSGSVLLWLFTISKIITNAEGSSERAKPIKNIFYISNVKVSLNPSQLPSGASKHYSRFVSGKTRTVQDSYPSICSQDSFFLSFSLYQTTTDASKSEFLPTATENFTLYLQPIHSQFIHPNAQIHYQSNNSTDSNQPLIISQSIISDQVLAYSGSVVQTDYLPDFDQSKWQSRHQDDVNIPIHNWANILIHHPYGANCVEISDKLIFEGAFQIHQRRWHIKSLSSYQRSRSLYDSEPIWSTATSKSASNMVAWSNLDDWLTISQQTEFRQGTENNNTVLFESNSIQMLDLSNSNTLKPVQHSLQRRQTMAADMVGLTTQNIDYGKTIGSTDGCPKTLKMVYMGIAVDCTYMRKYESIDSVRLAILNNMNIVSSLYQRTFNISLGIVEINLPAEASCPLSSSSDRPWNTDCPNSSSGGLELNERLNQFSQWRAKKGGSDGAGLWHLLTDCPNGSEVGVSWLGALCKVNADNGASGGTTSGTGVTAASPNEWQTMAHEIGHNFGAVHDCTPGCSMGDSCCPSSTSSCSSDKQYVMAPSSSTSDSTTIFSPCTIGNICSNLKPGNAQGVDSSCVTEMAQHYTVSLNQCGNGILEDGEDCDPGAIFSPCCQWGVCKFSPGSVCMPSSNSPCCSSTCQFTPSATPCNSSSSSSFSTGQCSGNSPQCYVN